VANSRLLGLTLRYSKSNAILSRPAMSQVNLRELLQSAGIEAVKVDLE
jgi:hypothetical protein